MVKRVMKGAGGEEGDERAGGEEGDERGWWWRG